MLGREMCGLVQVHSPLRIETFKMILNDAVKLFQSLGARKVPRRELKSIHGIYGYMMVMEEIGTLIFNGKKCCHRQGRGS